MKLKDFSKIIGMPAAATPAGVSAVRVANGGGYPAGRHRASAGTVVAPVSGIPAGVSA